VVYDYDEAEGAVYILAVHTVARDSLQGATSSAASRPRAADIRTLTSL
jgi:hypothetical protein